MTISNFGHAQVPQVQVQNGQAKVCISSSFLGGRSIMPAKIFLPGWFKTVFSIKWKKLANPEQNIRDLLCCMTHISIS